MRSRVLPVADEISKYRSTSFSRVRLPKWCLSLMEFVLHLGGEPFTQMGTISISLSAQVGASPSKPSRHIYIVHHDIQQAPLLYGGYTFTIRLTSGSKRHIQRPW